MVVRRERGKDGALSVGGQQIPFTNCSFTATYETNTTDWNDDFFQYTSVISGHATGSFEWVGSVPPARNAMVNADGTPRIGVTLQVRLQEETFRATRVVINDYERNAPADSNSDGSITFEADEFRFVR